MTVNRRRRKKLEMLKEVLGPGELRLDERSLEEASGDKWMASALPDAVAFPRSVRSVSKIAAFANKHGIPLTTRGAGYGYVGGCVPMDGGIALSMRRLNRIKQIHERDFVAVVQPGVVTEVLQEAARNKGMFYPPDPASKANCSIGGNVATNAGGPACLKYGVTRDYVLGLEVVLANGSVVRTGGRVHKNKTGFDLTRLMVGSEGMLGIVTEVTLKLLPLPPFRACISVGLENTKAATDTIARIFDAGLLPCALEVADAFTLAATRERTKSRLLDGCQAHLIVELDGQEKSVRNELAALVKLVRRAEPLFVRKAFGSEACETIWALRREFSYSLRDTGLRKLNEDIVVPRGRLGDLFALGKKLQRKHAIPIACFGHAGDGNIHVNVMVDDADGEQVERSHAVLDELFSKILEWEGAITGEHGIGLAKKPWWDKAVSRELNELHRTIKAALDPQGILNPGKFLD